jgi:hypothetical protein
MSKYGLIKFTTTWTWGKPPPSLIIFFVLSHEASTQMSFCLGTPKLGVPKFSELKLQQLWGAITFCADLKLKWGLKQSCSPCLEHSNPMWHVTWMKVNQGDSWLLMVGSQIVFLTPNLSFGYNLCFKYPNGSYELNLNT